MLRGTRWENKKHEQQGREGKDNDDLSVTEDRSELGCIRNKVGNKRGTGDWAGRADPVTREKRVGL